MQPVGTALGRLKRCWRYRVVIFFALGLIGVDAWVEAHRDRWRTYSPDDYRERLHGCRQRPQDLIVVGGSPVGEGIDPARLLGLTWQGRPVRHAYALGLSGGTTSEFYHAVTHGAAAPPRLLVYGITASDLNDRRNEPHGPYSLMTWGDLAYWVRTRPKSAEFVTRHFVQARLARAWRLFHYRNGIRLWAAERIEQVRPGTFPEAAEEARVGREYTAALRGGLGYAPNAGFVHRRYDLFKAAGGRYDGFDFLEGYRLGEHLGYLHRLLDWADANGVAVVLVDMPITVDLEQRYAAAFAQYREALAEVARSRRVRVLHADRTAVGLADAHFADRIHLNADGAARLSDWVRRALDGRPGIGS